MNVPKSSIWTKNIFTKLSEIWVGDQELGIRDQEKTSPGSGAMGKKTLDPRSGLATLREIILFHKWPCNVSKGYVTFIRKRK